MRGGVCPGVVSRPRVSALLRGPVWPGRNWRPEPPGAGAGRSEVLRAPGRTVRRHRPEPCLGGSWASGCPGGRSEATVRGRFLFPEGLFSESTPEAEPAAQLPELAACSLGPSREVPPTQRGTGPGSQPGGALASWSQGARCGVDGRPGACPAPADLTFPAGSPVWLRCRDPAGPEGSPKGRELVARALGQEGHLDSPGSRMAVGWGRGGAREAPIHSACVAPRSQCLARLLGWSCS